ncbi:hypothetical protein B0J15DRAFT_497965 [Fusarium solani]|uniref:Zn(2)-C6 fungal-type domain-containing protein n=1 Tax=Fusarium solani TaxID=169388 RepID=A0A9P9KA00_FUSSL|nr:uncharacterized protein B0J15DRAFT_497965 [Fusarium solani]KAH7249600.1 hypothetical protein B0J15DRAFT_497965 [Fusarium solani]
MPPTGPRRPGCENCRARHLKCDGEKPCAQCVKKNIDCNRNLRVRFRHKSKTGEPQPEFSTSQVWCKTAGKRLKFLDQSLEVARYYDDDAESDGESRQPLRQQNLDRSTSPPGLDRQPVASLETTSSAGSAGLAQQTDRDYVSPIQGSSGSSPRLDPGLSQPPIFSCQRLHHVPLPGHAGGSIATLGGPRQYHPFSNHSPSSFNSFSHDHTSTNADLPPAPLNDRTRAKLFRHYIKYIAPAFDSYDPTKYLSTCVPSIAATCPAFLELVLVVAAGHLHAVQGGASNLELDVYRRQLPSHDDFLQQMIQSGMDMSHLDVAVLLYHFCENLQATSIHNDASSNLILPHLDMSRLHVSPLLTRVPITFHDAVMWACLRQELFLAVMNQAPIDQDTYRSGLEHLTHTSDDFSRTNRMLLKLMEVVRFCFGEGKDTTTYDELLESTASWMRSTPASFTPVMTRRKCNGEPFPEIWLLNDCIAAGLQYYHLSRILLIVHDPRVPRLCRARREASRWIDAQVRNDLEIICGIAESMSKINPMHITACMAISMVGDRCSQRSQQGAVINILDKTTTEFGWSTDLA